MTRDELQGLITAGVLTAPFLDALDAIDIGETAGRAALKRGDLPFRVIRVGKALRVPVRDLEALLLTPDIDEAGPASPAVVTTTSSDEGEPSAKVRRLSAQRSA